MSCCGGRRKAHKAWLLSRPVRLHYLGAVSVRVLGRVPGTSYEFSPASPEADVDARDAAGLLRTATFRLAAQVPGAPEPEPPRRTEGFFP